MSAIVGSARIDERGKAYGGKAGNQTGKEIMRQKWYLHSRGWRVLRAKSSAMAAAVARAMDAACENAHIGYDQYQRDTLLKAAAACSPIYDPGAVNVDCETDCSALVRVCVACACGRDAVGEVLNGGGFNTANEVSMLLKTGLFIEMTGAKYQETDSNLMAGDILCTKTKGHTVVVLTNGSNVKADKDMVTQTALRFGNKGSAVTELQRMLLQWDPACLPKCGADGDFGSETEKAVRAFQKTSNIPVTGTADAVTMEALGRYKTRGRVRITGQTVNVRSGPGAGNQICAPVVKCGSEFSFSEKADVDGTVWYHISTGWISGKHSKEV